MYKVCSISNCQFINCIAEELFDSEYNYFAGFFGDKIVSQTILEFWGCKSEGTVMP